ncbi:hypothetical protein D3C81_1668950 [compost metagenome]
MILMAVRQQNAPDLVLVINQITDVGNDNINAEHVLLGKFQTRINYNNIIRILHYIHVLADLAHAA